MRTRTSNLLIRSQVLYPIELWALMCIPTTELDCFPFNALIPVDRSRTRRRARIEGHYMPTTGLEPVRHFWHWSLKPACLPVSARGLKDGAERDRTADLLNAIQALSQLSYSPKQRSSDRSTQIVKNLTNQRD